MTQIDFLIYTYIYISIVSTTVYERVTNLNSVIVQINFDGLVSFKLRRLIFLPLKFIEVGIFVNS